MTRHYHIYAFDGLNVALLHAIMKLRAEVFVVEQNSPYLDPDEYDQKAHHVCLMENGELIGYSRLLGPGIKFDEASVGRIVVALPSRGNGTGKKLVQRSIDELRQLHGSVPIRIEAQYHLRDFYESFGFTVVSEIYDWGGIPHVKMVAA